MKKNITLGKYIFCARLIKGISQRELAKQTNIDHAEVSRLESGKRKKVNVLCLLDIANVLNVDSEELIRLAGYTDREIKLLQNFK